MIDVNNSGAAQQNQSTQQATPNGRGKTAGFISPFI